MKKRSIAAAAMSLAIAASFTMNAALPVYAQTAAASTASSSSSAKNTEALTKALETIKSRITIPEDYTDFSYSSSVRSGIDTFSFTWKQDSEITSGSLGYINVRISGDVITYFNHYDPSYKTWGDPAFARLSTGQLIGAAKNAVKMLDPDIADQLSYDENVSPELRSSTITVSFTRQNEGLDFDKNSGYVNIDKNTGELISFSLTWWGDAKFKKADTAVSVSDIEAAYRQNVTLTPYYRIKNDDGKLSASIVYAPDKTVLFDADLAKPTTMLDDFAVANNTSNYTLDDTVEDVEEDAAYETTEAVSAGAGISRSNPVFTDAEKKALLDSGKYYSKTDAVKLLKDDKYLGLTDKYVLSSAEMEKTSADDGSYSYLWNFNFYINTTDQYKQMYVTMDAESGKILSYRKYDYSSGKKSRTINIKSVNKIAEAAAEYYLPEIFGEYRADESNTADAKGASDRTLVFDRYVNDIQVSGNSININVNSDGEVMSFDYDYDDIKFPEAKIISADQAYDSLFKQTDFDLYYSGFRTLDGKAKTYMLYFLDTYYINAKTGRLCSYDGGEYNSAESSGSCPYTDISGTWAEKYITKLYDYGITLSVNDNKFSPDSAITEREFARLLDSLYYSEVMPLLYGDYAYDDTSTLGNSPLTKAESAKLYILARDGKAFAELKGIYKSPFKDVKSTDSNVGYISLAYAMGAVKGDSSGNFNPDSKITRAYAMYMIYNIIASAN